jgi:hypothetical protein
VRTHLLGAPPAFLARPGRLAPASRQLEIGSATESLLLTASTSTLDRHLRQLRSGLLARRMSQTKPGTSQVPVVVGRWKRLDRPGYLEIDLVSHSGEIASGEWIETLTGTDLSTGWTERVPIFGPRQTTVLGAVKRVRQQLPFPLLGLHPDWRDQPAHPQAPDSIADWRPYPLSSGDRRYLTAVASVHLGVIPR